jgi:hypothetical protein
VAKAAVTQNMFRRFDVTTGKSPDRSGAFNGLAFLRDLRCCRIAGFLRAMEFLLTKLGLRHLGIPLVPPLTGLGARVSARSQMRPTKRLKTLVSESSTVRTVDELSLQLSA